MTQLITVKTLLALSLLGATAAVSAQVVTPVNPTSDANGQRYGSVYGTSGAFNSPVAANPADFGWGIHGYLRQNTFFNSSTTSASTATIDTVNMPLHQAAWVQGGANGVDDNYGGSFNQRGASLTGIANPSVGPTAYGPQVGNGGDPTYRLPPNFQGVGNPSERQAGVVSSNPGIGGATGYLSAFGRSLGNTGVDVGNRSAPYLDRDVNRTLFWTETGVQTNGKYMTGVQFDVINQNNSTIADGRATLAVRMGTQWYIAAVLDSGNGVYLDPSLPNPGGAFNLDNSDISGYTGGNGAYTLFFDFRNQGDDNRMEARYVWYELNFDGTIGGDPTLVNDGGNDSFSLDIPLEFGTEDPSTLDPVYVTFSNEDLANVTAWGVFMRYANSNRRIDNFFLTTAPGGGATSAQKSTQAKAQRDALRAARWAHHVRTQQQQRAAQHRRSQQR